MLACFTGAVVYICAGIFQVQKNSGAKKKNLDLRNTYTNVHEHAREVC